MLLNLNQKSGKEIDFAAPEIAQASVNHPRSILSTIETYGRIHLRTTEGNDTDYSFLVLMYFKFSSMTGVGSRPIILIIASHEKYHLHLTDLRI